MRLLASAVVWLASLVTTAALTILLTEPIHWALAKRFGRFVPRRPRSVQGVWHTKYNYVCDRTNTLREEVHEVELRQFGRYVWGRNRTGRRHFYEIRGVFDRELYFTGTWANTSKGDIYHGAFQFVLSPDGKTMEGKWVGFDCQHEVNHGQWQWRLINPRLDRESRIGRKHRNMDVGRQA